jgi:hypothetical protein
MTIFVVVLLIGIWKINTKYVYFVSYSVLGQLEGRCEIVRKTKVTSIEDVKNMEDCIKGLDKDVQFSKNIIINNYNLLRVER